MAEALHLEDIVLIFPALCPLFSGSCAVVEY
jgi:hypothetical protein